MSVHYLDSVTGKLTILSNIKEITAKPLTKYYKTDKIFFLREYATSESVSKYTGKNNNTLNFYIYVAVPVVVSNADTIEATTTFLGVKYDTSTSKQLSGEERQNMYEEFAKRSDEDFATNHEHYEFKYLERLGNTYDADNFTEAAKKNIFYKENSKPLILLTINKPFERRNGNTLRNIFIAYGICCLVWLIMILIPGVHEEKANRFLTGEQNSLFQWGNYINGIKDVAKDPVTTILIALNILVFIAMVLAGSDPGNMGYRDLIKWGACYKPGLDKGEWWRLITSMFLHGGFAHLIMNMVSLGIAGMFVKPLLSDRNYILGYLITGIAAAVVRLWWHDKPVVAVGASGAIFGLFGIILSSIVFKRTDVVYRKTTLIILAFTAGYGLLMGFLTQGVDNSAHLGGLIAGFIYGVLVSKKEAV